MRLRFKICKWLEKEDFFTILKWAEYIGRHEGCSIFETKINPIKIEHLENLIDKIKSFGGILDPRDEGMLKRIIEEARAVHVYAKQGGFLIKSKSMLADYLKQFRERKLIFYSREEKAYLAKPYAIIDIIERLKNEGFRLEDHTGLFGNTPELNVSFKGSLRDYQREALESWVNNRFRGVIALPTGSGKTIIALAAIALLKKPTLIVVYTKEQMFEWKSKILKFLEVNPSAIGLFYSDEKNIKPLTIATYQSAYRNVNVLYDKFSLLVVDEAHHLPADKFRTIAENVLAPYRLALSATPYREDGKHEDLFRLVGGIVYEKPLIELLEKGFIASFQVIPVKVELSPRERREYDFLRKEYTRLACNRTVEELVKMASQGDDSARRALQLLNKMRMMLALSQSKLEEAKRIVENELSRGSKIIIFTQYVRQAEKIGKLLSAPVITGKTDRKRRQLVLELFKRGRYRVIVLTTVGDEGIDVPDANVGIILSGTSSRRQFIQRLGRLLRPQPGKESRLYYIAVKGTQEEYALKRLAEQVRNLALTSW